MIDAIKQYAGIDFDAGYRLMRKQRALADQHN